MPKTNKYTDLSLEELEAEESELRTVLFNLRVQNTTKALHNTNQIRENRRQLARLLMEMGNRGAAAGK